MLSRHLYITDLDGTLLNREGVVSDSSRELIQKILREGIDFTVATARHIASVKPLFKDIPLTLPVVTGGGAYVSSVRTGNHEFVNAMERETAWSVYHQIISFHLIPFISSYNGRDNLSYFQDLSNPGMRWYLDNRETLRDSRLRMISDPAEALNEQVVSLFVIDRLPVIEELYQALDGDRGEQLSMHVMENLYSREWYWLMIHDAGSTKDRGAEMIMKKHGYKKNEVTAFGDNVNDVDLFRAAGRRIAVANATESLKVIADEVIGSNEEDSVPRFVLRDNGFG